MASDPSAHRDVTMGVWAYADERVNESQRPQTRDESELKPSARDPRPSAAKGGASAFARWTGDKGGPTGGRVREAARTPRGDGWNVSVGTKHTCTNSRMHTCTYAYPRRYART